jgi:hypothetical protein
VGAWLVGAKHFQDALALFRAYLAAREPLVQNAPHIWTPLVVAPRG